MSKTFIKTALTKPPQGFEEIIQWLYLPSRSGPKLLRLVVEECRALLPNAAPEEGVSSCNDVSGISEQESQSRSRLSSGALVLLRRNLQWLEEYLQEDERLMEDSMEA